MPKTFVLYVCDWAGCLVSHETYGINSYREIPKILLTRLPKLFLPVQINPIEGEMTKSVQSALWLYGCDVVQVITSFNLILLLWCDKPLSKSVDLGCFTSLEKQDWCSCCYLHPREIFQFVDEYLWQVWTTGPHPWAQLDIFGPVLCKQNFLGELFF